jgi:glycosyltransferase involved in cell wall biosynthesis
MKSSICFFNTIKSWGGGEKWHFEMATFLASKNYDVHFITSKKSNLANKLKKTSVKTFFVDVDNLSFLNIVKVNKVAKYLRVNNLKVVVINSSQDMKLGGLAAKKAKVSHIIYRRGSAIPIKNSLVNRYFFSKIITNVIANSLDTKKTVNANANLFPNDKIYLLRNGIDLESYNYNESVFNERRNSEKIILGNLGRLVKQKNQLFLVEVANELKNQEINFHLVIGGSGGLQKELELKIAEYNLKENVSLEGFIKVPEVFFKKIDVFLLSSLWEGFGYVIAEAMLFKKPVIAFNCSSNPELITTNENGFLTQKNNVKEFVDKIKYLANNAELRKSFGENGQQKIVNEYDSKLIKEQFLKYINSLAYEA